MGQTSSANTLSSAEYARLLELGRSIDAVQGRAHRLRKLADAEVAANIPPTPSSSQAAYHVVMQHFYELLAEEEAIYRRMADLDRGSPDPMPMPKPTPPLPAEGLPMPEAAVRGSTEASTLALGGSSAAGLSNVGTSSEEPAARCGGEDAAAGAVVPLPAGGVRPAGHGLRHRHRQEGVR
ncbi:hypothetical protein ABPG77_010155 [Micractinium sp. CCAP 211/92]